MLATGQLKSLQKRLEKLQQQSGNKFVRFTMPDSTTRTMHIDVMFSTFCDAVVGVVATEAEIMLASISDNSGTRLSELLKAILK